MNTGRVYKRVLDVLRQSRFLTYLIFRVPIRNKLIPFTWDVTTLVLKKAIDKHVTDGNKHVLDMGCGHIALLAQYVKKSKPTNVVMGADFYAEFVTNAERNASANNLQITFRNSDLYAGVTEKFDFILSNLPYVPTTAHPSGQAPLSRGSGTPEKTKAYPLTTFSGEDGTDTTRRFLQESKDHLRKGGKILMGVNCFHLPEEKVKTLIESFGYQLDDVVGRRFNTAYVFVLRIPSSPTPGAATSKN